MGHHTQFPWKTLTQKEGEKWGRRRKSERRIGSWWMNTLTYIHQYSWNPANKAADSSAALFLARQIATFLLNLSIYAVKGGDEKWSNPRMEWVEVILITLAFISAGWLKMIKVPELKLILRDWLLVKRLWHNRCKWSHFSPIKSSPDYRHQLNQGLSVIDYDLHYGCEYTVCCSLFLTFKNNNKHIWLGWQEMQESAFGNFYH